MCSITQSCPTLQPHESYVAHHAPLPMEFSQQEFWSGSPFPSPGDLPNPGIEPMSPALAGGFFTTDPPWYYYLKTLKQGKVKKAKGS